jgi:hypothetical protein
MSTFSIIAASSLAFIAGYAVSVLLSRKQPVVTPSSSSPTVESQKSATTTTTTTETEEKGSSMKLSDIGPQKMVRNSCCRSMISFVNRFPL